MNYRPEIDGLRALAVLPVVLYHSKINLFQGGFVGVDIFFVISGFLITKIIITEVFQSSFSIIKFYERRARRILPALFTVLIFSTVLSWALLPPIQFKDFGQSLFFVSFFTSNILFWIESGYFTEATELKPLIHTWSLGVEEQFYIFFPLLVLFIYKINKKYIFPSIFLILTISLFLSYIYSAPNIDTELREAAFFLLPTRAWELMLGSILCLSNKHSVINSNGMFNNFMSFIGLLLIFYSILFFGENTPFPGLYALVPTLGAAFIIVFGTNKTYAFKLLTIKPMIFIGLTSYSIYLWHQPLLAFSRFYFIGELSSVTVLLIIITSIFLGYCSWRYIEQPFRDKNKISRKNIFIFSIAGTLILSSIGMIIHLNDGFKNRYSTNEIALLDFQSYEQRDELYRERDCLLKQNQDQNSFKDICKAGETYIWGDSHAAGLYAGINLNEEASQFTASGCPPILNIKINAVPNCASINDYIYSSIEQAKPRRVFLSAYWIHDSYEGSDDLLLKTLSKISNEHPSVEFYVLGGLPIWFPSLPVTMLKADNLLNGQETYIENQLFKKIAQKDEVIKTMVLDLNNKNIKFISMLDLLCEGNHCLTQAAYPNIEPIAFDYGHLTRSGSVEVSSRIFDVINHSFNNN